MVAFPDPQTKNAIEPGCSRCPALVQSRNRISWGTGSLEADIIIVGEAPARGDPTADQWQGGNWTGMAYTGRHSGQIIRGMFEELGYGPSDLYVTNSVKCYPSNGAGSNREPTQSERDSCYDHLLAELTQVDPAVVIATGKHATQSILDREPITIDKFVDSVLQPIKCPVHSTVLLPLLHPAYQHVWLTRLGYSRAEYIRTIGDTLEQLLDD